MMNEENQNELDKIFDEDINFTAITDGLGFHHSVKSKSDVQKDLKTKSTELKRDFDSRIKQLSNRPKTVVDMGDLSPFYSKAETSEMAIKLERDHIEEAELPINLQANIFERFGAWLVDFIMVSVLFFVMFLSVVLITNTPLAFVRDLTLGKEFFLTLLPLFAGFYLFYFSFFDKTVFSSPGKKIFGLKVMTISNESPTLIQAGGRALVTLLSVFTMGLLVFLDAQSRLTDTKVIKRS